MDVRSTLMVHQILLPDLKRKQYYFSIAFWKDNAGTHIHITAYQKLYVTKSSWNKHIFSTNKHKDWKHVPASRTKTLSQSMTVGILCAMLIIVHDENSCRVIFWIVASVWESTEAVASSINKIWVCFKMTRPRQRSCLWPTLQFSLLSATMKKQNDRNEWTIQPMQLHKQIHREA